jgi:VWFA-related protein
MPDAVARKDSAKAGRGRADGVRAGRRSCCASSHSSTECTRTVSRRAGWPAAVALLAAVAWLSPPAPAAAQDAAEKVIRITSPHGRLPATGPIRIVAQADDEPHTPIVMVRFYVDEAFVGDDVEGPVYAVEWRDDNPFKAVTIRAEAFDEEGRTVTDTVTLPALEITDETSVVSVILDVAVLDSAGRHVAGLGLDAFALSEDDVPQDLAVVDAARVANTYTLLVDASQSMSYRFDFVRRAVRRIGGALRADDQLIIVPFTTTLGPVTGPTRDVRAAASAVERMRSAGGTAIADALAGVAERLGTVEGRHIIVLFTDGYDEHSQAKIEDAARAVQKMHGTLYTVGIPGAAGISIRGRDLLKQLAERCGGRAFFPIRDEELPIVQDRIGTDVAQRYLLTYTPSNQAKDGAWRAIQVTTPGRDYAVRTREGYFAAAPPPIRPTVEFTVRTRDRQPIRVGPEDVIVREDGVDQAITSFQEATAPVSIVMALDQSGSMRRDAEAVKAAAGAFIDAARPEDALGVLTFSDGVELVADVAKYRSVSKHAVSQYRTTGGTALFDGIVASLDRLATETGRKALVLLTDGRDENGPGTAPGSKATRDEVLARLRDVDVTVFAIGLGPSVDRETLQRVADASGGDAYFPADVSELPAQYARVIEELRRRYVIGYTSTNARRDGAWRSVELLPKRENLEFVSRGGYQAPAK